MENNNIIEFNVYYDKGFWYIEPKVNGRSKARLNLEFLTEESALQYIAEHREKLEKKYMPKSRNTSSVSSTSLVAVNANTNESENENTNENGNESEVNSTSLVAVDTNTNENENTNENGNESEVNSTSLVAANTNTNENENTNENGNESEVNSTSLVAVNANTNESEYENINERENPKKGGKIVVFAAGALAGIVTTALILTSKCAGCKGKGIPGATDPGNALIVFGTNTPKPTADIDAIVTSTPDAEPTFTIDPTGEPVAILTTLDDINVMIDNIFNQYPEYQQTTDIIVGSQLVRYQLTKEDLRDAIICLNCDDLEVNSYSTFSRLREGRDADSIIYNYQCVITLISQLNINRFMNTKSVEGIMPLSALIINEQSRNEANDFENDCLNIWKESLNYDPWLQSNNGPVCDRIQSMVDDLTAKTSSNTVGMNSIISIHYSTLGNVFGSMVREDQIDTLSYLCNRFEDTNYNVIRNTLLLDNNQSYNQGCAIDSSSYKKTKVRNI